MRAHILVITSAIAAFAAAAASASVYNIEGTFDVGPDASVSLDLDLTAGPTLPSAVTAISGTVDGDAITGLSSYAAADNILLSVTPYYVDVGGISFTTSADTYNFYAYNNANYVCAESEDGACYYSQGNTASNLTVTQVPEPATWALMVAGFAALGGGLRARRHASVAA